MTQRIEDYALIGDTHTAALVGRDGSIDWLCLPRFDSPACFAAILGDEEHGRWLIAPAGGVRRVHRAYRDTTMILETTFETDSGQVTLIDFMPMRQEEQRVHLVRFVRCDRGSVPMEMDLVLRFSYGSAVPWVRSARHGLSAISGPDAVQLWSPVHVHGEDFHSRSNFTVSEGETIPFTLTWHPSHKDNVGSIDPKKALENTEKWWRDWAAQCTLDGGDWRHLVMRSLATLKALTYSPSGGLVAAPTTSLPESPGGVRNWDYRYCWLRDSTFTLYSLLISGFKEEARQWRDWLLRSVMGKPSQMQIMYGIGGERLLPELEITWLPGYEGSKPVRVGNAAHRQLQLDVFGEIMDTLHTANRSGIEPEDAAWALQQALMDYLETVWDKPDDGMWEIRGPRQNFTHSKVMAWVAFDRAIKSVERYGLEGPVDHWRKLREKIHKEVCAKGFDAERNTFVQTYGGKGLDAALLMIPLVGFLPAPDKRVAGTLDAIGRELLVDGVVHRYSTNTEVDGLPPGEGAFLACSFWYADNLQMLGRVNEARAMFDRLVGICNDVGLLAEEYDPVAKRQLGNFPQAFSHVALINTAHNLSAPRGPAEHRASN